VKPLIAFAFTVSLLAQTKAFVTSGTSWSAATNGAPITVECIGGGGGGSGGGTATYLAAGGGGEYGKVTVAYTSGASIPITIGQGGTGTTGDGTNGAATTWNTNVLVCNGGKGGTSAGGSGAGGTGGDWDTAL